MHRAYYLLTEQSVYILTKLRWQCECTDEVMQWDTKGAEREGVESKICTPLVYLLAEYQRPV